MEASFLSLLLWLSETWSLVLALSLSLSLSLSLPLPPLLSPSLPPDCLCPPAETLHPSLSICQSGSLLPPQKFSSSVPREGMSRHTPPLKLVQILALLLISFGTTVELSNLSAPISHLGNRDNNNTYSIRWLRQLNN